MARSIPRLVGPVLLAWAALAAGCADSDSPASSGLPLPSQASRLEYQQALYGFLGELRYRELGWSRDKRIRDSGPYLDGTYYGTHPAVRVHPETGRKALFVDELWTERIVELEADESASLLAFLFDHVKKPNFTVRWQWRPNDLALWDNRAFQHYAVNDYTTNRVMQKSLLAGDRPYGPARPRQGGRGQTR